MSEAGFTYAAQDPGLTTGRYGSTALLENRRMSLVPAVGRRTLAVPSRPGSWEFTPELGERAIDLELALVRSTLADLDGAIAALADLFDPTEGAQQLIFDSLPDRYFLARLTGEPIPTLYPAAARVSLSMRCADPFAYSTALYTVHGGSATITGFSAYRQAPERINWNLVKNAGFQSGATFWTPHANATVVDDATSVTGKALRLIATAAFQNTPQILSVEAGKVYSFAVQGSSDGTATANLTIEWLDAAGAIISSAAVSRTNAAYGEMNLTNQTAPGNARQVRLNLTCSSSSGIVFFTAVRVKQQATAPAAWSASDQQVLTQKGLAIYEAATNLLTNGDIETALSGTVNAFDEQYADANAWTPALNAPVANVTNLTIGTTYVAGHPEWWDHASGSRFRWQWTTGGVMYLYLKYVDVSNWIRLRADGTGFSLEKNIAGTTTVVSTVAAALTTATWYWFQWTITGTSYAATLDNDSAGAPGSNVATITAQTISDAAVQTARIAVGSIGSGLLIGGAFADVCLVKIAAPPGFAAVAAVGVPAFAVSKATKFSGTSSLGGYVNVTAHDGRWRQVITTTAASYALSCRAKTAGGAAQALDNSSGVPVTQSISGANDWTVLSGAGVNTAGAHNIDFKFGGAVGSTWFDLCWFAQQSYDTGNADPSGLAYSTGTRPASAVTLPVPAGISVNDFAVLIAFRPDHAASTGHDREVFLITQDVNNYLRITMFTGGSVWIDKFRNNVRDAQVSLTAYAAGDSVVAVMRFRENVGFKGWASVNGAAIVTAESTTVAAKQGYPSTSVATINLSPATREPDVTVGAVRILRAGLTDAQLAAIAAAPYAAQDEALEFDVWRFEGAATPENYASGTLDVDVGGTYKALPTVEITAGAAFTGNLTLTDESSRVLTWNGTLALNDVLKIESDTQRVRKNNVLSMSGVAAGSKWPELLPAQENNLVIGGIPSASVKAVRAEWRNRWL